ncbi:hypothetical protein [Erwinia piriflorinigrans]|uniref:Uncharacterized protein n=1 Tax=Erwinia piriflorinigrans CFBP 5888 TaxID=1161919 RepID=V5ZBB4_9GAMM|nr:hypothetical protein [Erwinia piriflorinigrans]CCG88535.1 hypothetical protein EPIR_3172 [Erwinia piriflorinigrans CFBP 5888]
MKLSLHGVSVWHSNAVTQLHIAHDSGFTGLELLPEHLFRYLDNGGSYAEYRQLMEKYAIEITCINALKRIGRHHPDEHAAMLHVNSSRTLTRLCLTTAPYPDQLFRKKIIILCINISCTKAILGFSGAEINAGTALQSNDLGELFKINNAA